MLYIANLKNSSNCLWKEIIGATYFSVYFGTAEILTIFTCYFSIKTETNIRQKKNLCFYEQSTAFGANTLNPRSLQPRKRTLVWERSRAQDGSAASASVPSERRESSPPWHRGVAGWTERSVESPSWGVLLRPVGLRGADSRPEFPGFQPRSRIIHHVTFGKLCHFSVLGFFINKWGLTLLVPLSSCSGQV